MKNYVGIDLGGTKMYMYTMVDGRHVEKKVSTGVGITKEKIKKELDDFLSELPFTPDGVGMALVGLVDGDNKVKFSDMSTLNGITTEYFSENRFKMRFINDVKAATLAEAANYEHNDTVAVIMAGTGFAVGIYSKGKVFTGVEGFAGEMGHCVIHTEDGPMILDKLAGGRAILDMAGCSAPELIEKLDNNDKDALALIEKAGYYFGLALTNIMHLFNPDIIVIGGSTATYKGYMKKALETAEKHTLKVVYDCCKIVDAKDPARIVALGALEYVKNDIQL